MRHGAIRSGDRHPVGGAAAKPGIAAGVRPRGWLGALRRWWAVGRHYRPERRYMRGGSPAAA